MAERSRGEKADALTGFGRAINQRIKDLQARDPQYTREMVARLVGMSRQHLWRVLRGKAAVTPVEVAQLARVLRIDPEELTLAYWADPHPEMAGTRRVPWTAEDVRRYFENLNSVQEPAPSSAGVRRLADGEDGSVRYEYTPRGVASPSFKSQIHRAMQEGELGPLPRELKIRAQEFRLEALRAGADDAEITFIDSVLASPEAIFRQSGYSEPLNADAQRVELDSVIEMLRAWLREHMRRRGALERSAGG